MRRRKKDDSADPVGQGADEATAPSGRGPWDASERPLEEDEPGRAHLGSLSVPGHAETELRLQVEEGSGTVAAVMLVSGDGALEVRPFAASRNHDMWGEVLPQLRDDITRQGGQVEEVEGPYGPALRTVISGRTPEGESVQQPALLLGIGGPRWLLRVTAFGRPAVEWREDGLLERQLSDMVVLRGSGPMPPGDPLPLELPADARRAGG